MCAMTVSPRIIIVVTSTGLGTRSSLLPPLPSIIDFHLGNKEDVHNTGFGLLLWYRLVLPTPYANNMPTVTVCGVEEEDLLCSSIFIGRENACAMSCENTKE